ncbi:MAG TPA: hypothetical protein VKG01_03645 [Thermoanaerobaculia bacterium]|nr:hypothetical protein [Thermoanaerobaculia bacterium]
MSTSRRFCRSLSAFLLLAAVLAGGAGSSILAVCGPFVDISDANFCGFVLEIFYLGITTGTSATTYDPTSPVSRLQMAAFLSRTVDGVLRRGSPSAIADRFWTPQNDIALGLTTVGSPQLLKSDGADVWVAGGQAGTVVRVRASDGKILETWTGATAAFGVLIAMGRVMVTGSSSPGNLYQIDPTQPAGVVTTVATNLGNLPNGIAFDGARVWTANSGSPSVSIVTPAAAPPWTVTTVSSFSFPAGLVFDGQNIWVSNSGNSKLQQVDAAGAVLLTVTLGGTTPQYPAFDGSSIWVPSTTPSNVTVVRASTGAILTTLTGNGLSFCAAAAFDGQRILVTNEGNNSVSLFKAADLSPLGNFPTGTASIPFGAASDGMNFWVTLTNGNKLAKF